MEFGDVKKWYLSDCELFLMIWCYFSSFCCFIFSFYLTFVWIPTNSTNSVTSIGSFWSFVHIHLITLWSFDLLIFPQSRLLTVNIFLSLFESLDFYLKVSYQYSCLTCISSFKTLTVQLCFKFWLYISLFSRTFILSRFSKHSVLSKLYIQYK